MTAKIITKDEISVKHNSGVYCKVLRSTVKDKANNLQSNSPAHEISGRNSNSPLAFSSRKKEATLQGI
jgi:hypothetical protein